MLRGDPGAPPPLEHVAESLSREPDSRRIDDRQQIVEVILQNPKIEMLVPVMQLGQGDILVERILDRTDTRVYATGLDVLVDRAARQQTLETQFTAFAQIECRALVEQRIPH